MAGGLAQVLVRDADLASALESQRLHMAQHDLVAATIVAWEGPWDPEADAADVRGGIGLLLLEGLVVRRVGRDGRYGTELLGPGDLMRPWEHDGEDVTMLVETSFHVIEHAVLALLDLRFAARAAQYPEVIGALVGRAMQRSRSLALHMAIVHYPRIDRRLLMLMWHLADRWGRVTPDGVRLPLRLTHQLLADLVASRRPSVTTALQRLARDGHLTRRGDSWLLCGEPPAELAALQREASRR